MSTYAHIMVSCIAFLIGAGLVSSLFKAFVSLRAVRRLTAELVKLDKVQVLGEFDPENTHDVDVAVRTVREASKNLSKTDAQIVKEGLEQPSRAGRSRYLGRLSANVVSATVARDKGAR